VEKGTAAEPVNAPVSSLIEPMIGGSIKHAACGTRLDAEGRCPACQVTPAAQDILTESGPPPRASRDDPVALALREPHRLLEPPDVD
jgi:hypothetical protein